ncbi:MAG: transposase, partial [Candidatus Dadabacteria bacterium]|nr:transposase [Candidatus Dadabacteria bacterium]
LIYDWTIKLSGPKSIKDFPEHLRAVKYRDKERNKKLVFITNNFSLPAITICELYRNRWHVEMFFKWIKQHLRIKSFYGTSENAVKSQVWIAVSVYVLIAIIKKRLGLEHSFHTILQVLNLTLFEKIPLNQLLTKGLVFPADPEHHNQLKLFD